MKYFLVPLTLLLLCTSNLVGQSLQIKEVNTESYPRITLQVVDRNPMPLEKTNVQLFEENNPADSVTIVTSNPISRPYKRVFILFENSHFASFDAQRNYLKTFLSNSMKSFSNEDELYFSEFDWTLPDGKVLKSEGIYKGKKEQIGDIVTSIKKPGANGKTHESTELNTALIEALEYLDNIPEDPQFEKAIILFSSEFSNIYNSIHTPESIILSARKKNIPIYTVRYPRMAPKYTLSKITESTYGVHLGIDLSKDQEEQILDFQKVIEEMTKRAAGNQYLISYTTGTPPGSKPLAIKLMLTKDPVSAETILITPSYVQYVLMDTIRLSIAGGVTLLVVLGIILVLLNLRNKGIREKQENERKLLSIQEESRREIEKQEKHLEKLENERKDTKERDTISRREKEMEKAIQSSIFRFRQIPRVPFLSGQDGSNYPLGIMNLIGRNPQEGCTLLLSDSTVSKKHAYILFERISEDQAPEDNYTFYLVDLGSSNGTFVNGQQVFTPVNLKNGDLIKFGTISLTFRL